jgi:hypothetical protein
MNIDAYSHAEISGVRDVEKNKPFFVRRVLSSDLDF